MKLIDLFEKFSLTQINTEIDDSEIIAWCEKNASEYLSNPTPIFRGDSSGRDAIYHTNDFSRVSKNTLNYYTLWMDNHPQWSAYPKRSKSLICTTAESTAAEYSDKIFRVIPSNGCKIGVVPSMDLWYGFPSLRSFFKNAGMGKHGASSMDNLATSLYNIIALTLGDDVHEPDMDHSLGQSPLEKSWPKLKDALKEITYDLILDVVSEGEISLDKMRSLTLMAKKMNRMGYDNLYEMLDAQMDPTMNKFRVVGPAHIPAEIDRELWIGNGDCLVIRDHREYQDLFKKLGLIKG